MFERKFWPIGLASRARQNWSKNQKHPHFARLSQANPSLKSKKFFNRTKKTCRIRRGFEQPSSYSGWRVVTKKPRANLLARADVKGLNRWVEHTQCCTSAQLQNKTGGKHTQRYDSRSSQLQKHQVAWMSHRIAVKHAGHPQFTVLNFLNYTRIENVHKVRKKTFVLY